MEVLTLFSLVVVELILVGFSVFILRAGAKEKVSQLFILFLCTFFVWTAANYFSNALWLPDNLLIMTNRLLFVSSLGVVFALYCFTRVAVEIKKASFMDLHYSVLIVLCSLMGIFSLTPGIVESIYVNNDAVAINFGYLTIPYFSVIGLALIGTLSHLFKGVFSHERNSRAYAKVLLWSLGSAVVAITCTNVLAPLIFENFYLSTLGPLFGVLIIGGIGYAMVRHGLFGVKILIARSFVYIATVLALSGIYAVVIYGFVFRFVGTRYSFLEEATYFLVALFIGMTFPSIRKFFDKLSNKIFFRADYSLEEEIARVNQTVISATSPKELLTSSLGIINSTVNPEYMYCYILQPGAKAVPKVAVTMHFGTMNKTIHEDITRQLTKIYHLDKKSGHLGSLLDMQSDGINISSNGNEVQSIQIARFVLDDGLTGIYIFGQKQNGENYRHKDVHLIETSCSEITLALQNSLRLNEIQQFNVTLQDRINEATAQLRRSNRKLQQLDEAKDEFISMASHQLRTPLTSVKGYLSMALEGDAGKLTPSQQKLVEEAYLSSQRMVYLIGDFLNVSRLKTGKFLVEYGDVNMAAVIDEEISQLKMLAATRNLTINYKSPKDFPTSRLDAGKIRQAIMNLVDNAIYYSHENGAITLELTQEKNELIFTVTDQGIGVPQEDQKGLFEKFFRAKNGRRIRPDGTGIGLFMVKRVIDAHGGKVIFHSVEGKGSTFGFRVPLRTSEKS